MKDKLTHVSKNYSRLKPVLYECILRCSRSEQNLKFMDSIVPKYSLLEHFHNYSSEYPHDRDPFPGVLSSKMFELDKHLEQFLEFHNQTTESSEFPKFKSIKWRFFNFKPGSTKNRTFIIVSLKNKYTPMVHLENGRQILCGRLLGIYRHPTKQNFMFANVQLFQPRFYTAKNSGIEVSQLEPINNISYVQIEELLCPAVVLHNSKSTFFIPRLGETEEIDPR